MANLGTFFAGLFGKKANTNTWRTVAMSDIQDLNWWRGPTRSGKTVTPLSSLDIPVVLSAARVIAEGVAQLPLVIKKGSLNGDRMHFSPAYDHPAWNLLRKRPNSWMTSFEFREALTMQAVLNGNGYAYIVRGLKNRIVELIPIHSDMCQAEQLTDYTVQYRVSDGRKLLGVIPKEDILHIHGPSWNMFSGLNVVTKASEAIGLADALQDQQSILAGNGGRPSGVLSNKQPLSTESKEKLKTAWQERFGPGGEGGVAILDGEWNYASMSMSGVDQQHVQSREHQIAEIARAFRVFPQMLMSAVDKTTTYGSAEQFFIAHVKHTLGPWIERWEQAIERDILRDDAFECELDTAFLEAGTMMDRAEFYAKALGTGHPETAWLTKNDVRAREGYNPVDGGDEFPKPTDPAGQQQPQGQPAP
jgi:HK97 family phage portal protein